MGRVRLQLLLDDNTWSTRYTKPEKDHYKNSSIDWTPLKLNFTVENYARKIIYDEIDTTLADMCFSNHTTTHCVY